MNKKNTRLVLLVVLSVVAWIQIPQFEPTHESAFELMTRKLSINLGSGNCQWTPSKPLEIETQTYGTLLASYPGSGMRLVWQHTEALTGIEVGDDFGFDSSVKDGRTGIFKTHYPHQEGFWSFGSKMDQVILVIRNPRWALPSYHALLYEINYAQDFDNAYKLYDRVFTIRPPLSAWTKWRDYMFEQEIQLWSNFIDFWMENGNQYWMDLDFERNGQWPFEYLGEEEKKQDAHCVYELACDPKAVISYEKLRNTETGPDEAKKIADLLDGKLGMNVLDEEARPCIWQKTMEEPSKAPNDDSRDSDETNHRLEYPFTKQQMLLIEEKVIECKTKYSGAKWISNPLAQDIVRNMDEYYLDIHSEIQGMGENNDPTPAPNEAYEEELFEWYKSVGRESRYDENKAKDMDIYSETKNYYENAGEKEYHGHNKLRQQKYLEGKSGGTP